MYEAFVVDVVIVGGVKERPTGTAEGMGATMGATGESDATAKATGAAETGAAGTTTRVGVTGAADSVTATASLVALMAAHLARWAWIAVSVYAQFEPPSMPMYRPVKSLFGLLGSF